MPQPKYRTSKSEKRKRRSHHALKPVSGSICPNCNHTKLAHVVCPSCGFYRGKQVMAAKAGLGYDAADFDFST